MDAHSASLAASGETAVTSHGGPVLALGDEVTFTARHFGLPWRMTSRVEEYQRPTRFVDAQVRGPFKAMSHEHLFEAAPDGSTVMTDRITVTAPLGPLGALAERLLLSGYMRRLLVARAAHIKSTAESQG